MDCYWMKIMEKFTQPLSFFRCPFFLSLNAQVFYNKWNFAKFYTFSLFLSFRWRNSPSNTYKDFQWTGCLKALSVEMNGSAQSIRGRWNIHLSLLLIVKRSISSKDFLIDPLWATELLFVVVAIYLTKDILHYSPSQTKAWFCNKKWCMIEFPGDSVS